ncbi:hypothetical protein JOM56_009820 [Amanita muscaria]
MQLSGKSVATLVLSVLSIIFVIQPVKIPIGRDQNKHVPLNIFTAPILAIAVLWATQCVEASMIRDGIIGTDGIKPYNVLISFLSLAYMSITLDVTGVPEAAAHWVSRASGANGLRLYVNVYLMVTALSTVLGNDPVILSGTLFLLNYTGAMKLDSKPWLMSEFAAANTASMILFVGNPTNGVICEGFGIQNAAFTAYTILPFVACSTTCLAVLILQYRPTQIKLKVVDGVAPWKYIKDPISAVVGSILLVGCLITALVVSFLHIDFWKIALPFAGAKFVFETFWDLYRTQSNNRGVDEEMPRSYAGHVTRVVNEDSVISARPTDKRSSRSPDRLTARPKLPYDFVPFAFSQFILIEALANQGWIDVFARWLVIASGNQMFPTIWIVGATGIIFCNFAGTNIAGIALALASNIGAVGFVFSASLTGLLWKHMIEDHDKKNNHSREDANMAMGNRKPTNKITQREFARWNLVPLLVMTGVGLAVVSAEMAVLHRRRT